MLVTEENLPALPPAYPLSRISLYQLLFTNCIVDTLDSGNSELPARIQSLLEKSTEAVYRAVAKGLFERHKILFAFLLCTGILRAAGEVWHRKAQAKTLLFFTTQDKIYCRHLIAKCKRFMFKPQKWMLLLVRCEILWYSELEEKMPRWEHPTFTSRLWHRLHGYRLADPRKICKNIYMEYKIISDRAMLEVKYMFNSTLLLSLE